MSPPQHDELISVVMPVHNALPHLDAAVRSILGQTHQALEFVILDDASTDGSAERLREWAAKDSRIRLFQGERNLGPAASSNFVAREARGRFIARMDADDISHEDRLRRELEVLTQRPDAGLVGTLCDIIDGSGRRIRGPDFWRLRRSGWFAPFPHGSIMYRRELFDRAGGYREECVFWEDQDLFLRMAGLTKVLTIAEPLYEHRHSRQSTRLVSDQNRVEHAVDLMYDSMSRLDEGRDYESLLAPPQDANRRVDPRVFVSLGSLELWSGHRPRLFGRMLSHGRMKPLRKALAALVWTAWAPLSPGTLRLFLKALARLRNTASGRRDDAGKVVEWALPGTVRPPLPLPVERPKLRATSAS